MRTGFICHIFDLSRFENMMNQRHSGFIICVARRYPLIDTQTLTQPAGRMVANTGSGPGEK
jgi:hypothetical protein